MTSKLLSSLLTSVCASMLVLPVHGIADTPLGWINSSNSSAYTIGAGELEISLGGLAVNSTIDFLNIRDDLIANNRALEGDSGDFSGKKFELHYGITESLAVFYKQQQHSLTIDLGEIASVSLVDIDNSLDTTQQSAGFKWTFFEANILNPDNRRSAASLELSVYSNKSNDFDVMIDELRFDNLQIFFTNPQTFSVSELEDEGWKARFVYSFEMSQIGIASAWVGYGESKATSATTSDLTNAALKRFFKQSFKVEESYAYLGASMMIQIKPRIPLNISYEYINISNSVFDRFPATPPAQLPGFLSASSQSGESGNHTLKARISYWLSPQFNISLTGNLYSNQFLGVLPHYNNPLSGSFSSIPYGFAGIELGYKF
ncbi:MAG: hypothetical protein COA96_01065 [SAR86 cluster bacterium]|uniref:DUF5723 domain-containing protein n=1 Tax=SAR86 cluster bacterium TaxID=2030880 RepID=A0A2A5BA46_9GAMM|nr:MAG: hypothetical protein COA96_01065 [SAR86 cluster bacterium]